MNKNSIKQAAELAGVSVASVSRALNGKPGISEKTRQRIIDICDQLGYQPSDAARRLKIGKTAHIGLCMGNADKQHSHYISGIFEHLNQRLNAQNCVLSLYSAQQLESAIKESGGVILTGIEEGDRRIERLQQTQTPFVTIGQSNADFWVCPDDELGGQLAAQHLLGLACKQYVILESLLDGKGTKSRAIGFQKTLQKQGVICSHLYVETEGSVELQTYRTVSQMIKNHAFTFDGIFCETDHIAFGAKLACEDAGLNIAADVNIIGFDDLPGTFNNITTIRQDIATIAETALNLLQAAQQGQPARQVMLPVELIDRGSTRSQ